MSNIPEGAIPVLDKGYVRLIKWMGEDLDVVNDARASYDKESTTLTEKDIRLIRFLAKNEHTSPFRHSIMKFEVYAPLMIARQWWKHCVGSVHQDPMLAWNESSRRYVTEEPEFYIPSFIQWRAVPENKKQGSAGPLDEQTGKELTETLQQHIANGMLSYNEAMDWGLAPEQARLFLPAYAMYVRWRWTGSLQALLHFLDLRLGHDAQAEIVQYAEAVAKFVKEKFPESYKAWTEQ